MIPKIYLNKEVTNEELYEAIKDGMGITEVKEIKKDLNTTEAITEWSRFELRIDKNEVSLHQRWNKNKLPIVIILIITTFIIWVPFIYLMYKMYKERQVGKEILNKVGERINSRQNHNNMEK